MSTCIKELVKKCSKCKIISLKSNFHKNKLTKHGYRSACKICAKSYYLNNRDRKKEYYYRKRDQLLDKTENYNKLNREKINVYEKYKRKIDFSFKLAHNLRVKTHLAFKSQNVEKLNKTFDLIGCSQSFLRKWILYQLHGNMSEENYGSMWTIDHCYPLSKTNQSNETVMFKSSHWINLRPMYLKDNIIKGDRIDYHLYLLQKVKAKCFLKLNNDQQGLN